MQVMKHYEINYYPIKQQVNKMNELDQLREKILQFRDERNWQQFHNPKDLALSICLEAAELLEVFQWSGSDTACESKKDKISEELADVLNYCILMADACGLDMDEIVQEKIKRNNAKYPVEKAKDSAKKYDEL